MNRTNPTECLLGPSRTGRLEFKVKELADLLCKTATTLRFSAQLAAEATNQLPENALRVPGKDGSIRRLANMCSLGSEGNYWVTRTYSGFRVDGTGSPRCPLDGGPYKHI